MTEAGRTLALLVLAAALAWMMVQWMANTGW